MEMSYVHIYSIILLSGYLIKYSVIVLTETWLYQNEKMVKYFKNYNTCHACTKNGRGGRVQY